jgi:hypothetical protein
MTWGPTGGGVAAGAVAGAVCATDKVAARATQEAMEGRSVSEKNRGMVESISGSFAYLPRGTVEVAGVEPVMNF